MQKRVLYLIAIAMLTGAFHVCAASKKVIFESELSPGAMITVYVNGQPEPLITNPQRKTKELNIDESAEITDVVVTSMRDFGKLNHTKHLKDHAAFIDLINGAIETMGQPVIVIKKAGKNLSIKIKSRKYDE